LYKWLAIGFYKNCTPSDLSPALIGRERGLALAGRASRQNSATAEMKAACKQHAIACSILSPLAQWDKSLEGNSITAAGGRPQPLAAVLAPMGCGASHSGAAPLSLGTGAVFGARVHPAVREQQEAGARAQQADHRRIVAHSDEELLALCQVTDGRIRSLRRIVVPYGTKAVTPDGLRAFAEAARQQQNLRVMSKDLELVAVWQLAGCCLTGPPPRLCPPGPQCAESHPPHLFSPNPRTPHHCSFVWGWAGRAVFLRLGR
jgi:hypothetical protein